jgi:hypothetical protein
MAFSHALDEPGDPGRVGTIVFDNLHHGIGGQLSREADRYMAAYSGGMVADERQGICHIPGMVAAGGTVVTVTKSDGTETVGPTNDNFLFSVLFEENEKIYHSGGLVLHEIDPATNQWVLKYTNPNNDWRSSGRPVLYDGIWFRGLEFYNAHYSIGRWDFDGTTAQAVTGGVQASYFAASSGGLFKIARASASAAWEVKFTDATGANARTESNWVSMATGIRAPVSGLAVLGRYLLIFTAAGEIMALGEAPPIKTLVPAGALTDEYDRKFGCAITMWGSDLVIASGGGPRTQGKGCYALNIDRLASRDIHPILVQGRIAGGRDLQPSAVAAMDSDLLVGTVTNKQSHATGPYVEHAILRLSNFPDGLAYNFLGSYRDNLSPPRTGDVHDLLHFSNSTYSRIYALFGGFAGGYISCTEVPHHGGSKPTALADPSYVYTSSAYGPYTGRKLALQIRGFNGAALSTDTVEISLVPDADLSSPTVAGTFGDAGPFVLSSARIVATTFGLKIKLPDDSDWARILLPIFLDYCEEPRSGERIQLGVAIPTGVRRMDAGNEAVETFVATLQGLRDGTTKTLTLYDVAGTPSTFTVLVEVVETAQNVLKIAREYPEAAAVITVRVV